MVARPLGAPAPGGPRRGPARPGRAASARSRAGGEAARGAAAAAALGETLPLFGDGAEPGLHERVPLEESGVVELGPLRVRSFPLPHDGSGTVGYIVEARGMRFGYVTDLGHVTALVVERLKGCDALLVEMNHDPDLLREGPYPWDVKQRIASRHGHLSNEQGATLLEQVLGPDTRSVTLGHLSETNNQPAIALAAARLVLDRAGRGGVRLAAAEQQRPSERLGL